VHANAQNYPKISELCSLKNRNANDRNKPRWLTTSKNVGQHILVLRKRDSKIMKSRRELNTCRDKLAHSQFFMNMKENKETCFSPFIFERSKRQYSGSVINHVTGMKECHPGLLNVLVSSCQAFKAKWLLYEPLVPHLKKFCNVTFLRFQEL